MRRRHQRRHARWLRVGFGGETLSLLARSRSRWEPGQQEGQLQFKRSASLSLLQAAGKGAKPEECLAAARSLRFPLEHRVLRPQQGQLDKGAPCIACLIGIGLPVP